MEGMTANPRQPILIRPLHVAPEPRNDAREADHEQAHELFEHAAGLLASAGALRAAATAPGAAATFGPTLACFEASLEVLADAARLLQDHAVERARATGAARTQAGLVGAEVEHRFRRLIDALEDARVACAQARVAVGPVQSCARRTRW